MLKNKKTLLFLISSLFLIILVLFVFVINQKNVKIAKGEDPELIAKLKGYAYGEQVGWIKFDTAAASTTLYKTALKGYAYGEQFGWINFNPDGFGGVVYNEATGEFSGQAYAEQVGWIDFNPTGSQVVLNKTTKKLEGYAYGEQIGWISFGCENDNSCSTVDYGVSLDLSGPVVENMNASKLSYEDACISDDVRETVLSWDFDDQGFDLNQYTYVLKVLKSSDNSEVYKSFKKNIIAAHVNVDIDSSDGLAYDTAYKWSVEIFDKSNNSIGEKAGDEFTTYKSKFPNADDFTWHAPDPSVKEEIKFVSADLAKYYSGSSENDCNESNCEWEWSIDKAVYNADFKSVGGEIDIASTTIVIFNEIGVDKAGITLKVTDKNTGYYCSTSTEMGVKMKLPEWVEGGGR